MIRYYEITKHNSTVCGYPGRDFDWSKFCWDRKDRIAEENRCLWRVCKKGFGASQVEHSVYRAPPVFKDNYLIEYGCEYLHVPYDWAESGTVYRVRPNKSMTAGKVYRGHLIKAQQVIKRKGKWYWVLES